MSNRGNNNNNNNIPGLYNSNSNNNGTKVNKRIILRSSVTGSSSKNDLIAEIRKFKNENLSQFPTFDQYTTKTREITKEHLIKYFNSLKESFKNKINYNNPNPVSQPMNENRRKSQKRKEKNTTTTEAEAYNNNNNPLENLFKQHAAKRLREKGPKRSAIAEVRENLVKKEVEYKEELQLQKNKRKQEVKKLKELLKLINLYNQLITTFREMEEIETVIPTHKNFSGKEIRSNFSRPISEFLRPGIQKNLQNLSNKYDQIYDQFTEQLSLLMGKTYQMKNLQIKQYLSKTTSINKIQKNLNLRNLNIQGTVGALRNKLNTVRKLINTIDQANTSSLQLTQILKQIPKNEKNTNMEEVVSSGGK